MNLCGELEMINRLFQESRARDCQPIEELRRICCEETDRARRVRIDELSLQQERNPTTVSQLFTQIQDLQNKVNSLSNAGFFDDLDTASSSPTLENSEPQECLAAILDCRSIHGILWVLRDTMLNDYLLEKDHPQLSSTIQRI